MNLECIKAKYKIILKKKENNTKSHNNIFKKQFSIRNKS